MGFLAAIKVQLIVATLFSGVIAGFAWQNHNLKNDIKDLNGELGNARATAFLLNNSISDLEASIKKQNDAVAELMRQSDKLKNQILVQGDIIKDLEKVEQHKIELIDGEIVPETCEGAMGWMLAKAIGDFK